MARLPHTTPKPDASLHPDPAHHPDDPAQPHEPPQPLGGPAHPHGGLAAGGLGAVVAAAVAGETLSKGSWHSMAPRRGPSKVYPWMSMTGPGEVRDPAYIDNRDFLCFIMICIYCSSSSSSLPWSLLALSLLASCYRELDYHEAHFFIVGDGKNNGGARAGMSLAPPSRPSSSL